MPIQTVETNRLYRQIAEQLSALIASGEFAEGARLPSERELAAQLGVSRPSVREALIALEVAGKVDVRVGAGIFVSARRPLVWVRQDFVELESGALSISGLAELGLDPRLLVTVRAADADSALRTAADALACDALGAVVLEVWGEARQLDLVASRKLTLAAQASGVTGLLLRMAAEPQPSTAETRWIVRAAHSPPASSWSAWGAPVFDAQLVRNRHGPVGRWIMEWKCDECLFDKPAAHPQPVAAAPAHRPHQAHALAERRRVG